MHLRTIQEVREEGGVQLRYRQCGQGLKQQEQNRQANPSGHNVIDDMSYIQKYI